MLRRAWQRFCRSFKSPTGILGWAIVLISPIHRLVTFLGDVELVATYWSKMIDFLNTGPGYLVTTVVGAVIIGYAITKQSHEAENIQLSDYKIGGNKEPRATSTSTEKVWVDLEEPNYQIYDQWKEFKIYAVAFLWAERKPQQPMMMDPDAKATLKMLTDAISYGDLRAWHRIAGLPQRYYGTKNLNGVFTTRKDLIQFAEGRGLKPKFLYPEKRSEMI